MDKIVNFISWLRSRRKARDCRPAPDEIDKSVSWLLFWFERLSPEDQDEVQEFVETMLREARKKQGSARLE